MMALIALNDTIAAIVANVKNQFNAARAVLPAMLAMNVTPNMKNKT